MKQIATFFLFFLAACSDASSVSSVSSVDADVLSDQSESFRLEIARTGDGEGILEIDGEPCETPCSRDVLEGQEVSIQAFPALNASFLGWSNSCAASLTCVVTVTGDVMFTAQFALSGVLLSQDSIERMPRATASALDSQGNIYLVGFYRNIPLPGFEKPEPSRYVGYYAKFSPSGEAIWIKSFSLGSNKGTEVSRIGLDREDNLYIAGDDKTIRESFVKRINADTGATIWTIKADTAINRIEPDGLGGLFVIGTAAPDSDHTFGPYRLPSLDRMSMFIVRISKNGGASEPVRLSEGRVFVRGIIGLNTGGVLVSTDHYGTARLDRFRADGTFDSGSIVPNAGALALAPNGDIIISGPYFNALNWGPSPALQAPARARGGFFVGRWTANGSPLWLRTNEHSEEGSPEFVAAFLSDDCLRVAASGDIFVCGLMSKGAGPDFGNGPLLRYGGMDAYVVSYTSDGLLRWSTSVGSVSDDRFSLLDAASPDGIRLLLLNRAEIVTELGPSPAGHTILEYSK